MSKLITDYLRANRQFHRARKRRQHLLYVIYSHPNTYQELMNLLKSRHDRASHNIKAGQAKSKKKIGRPSKWGCDFEMVLAVTDVATAGLNGKARLMAHGKTAIGPNYKFANISAVARKHGIPVSALRYWSKKDEQASEWTD